MYWSCLELDPEVLLTWVNACKQFSFAHPMPLLANKSAALGWLWWSWACPPSICVVLNNLERECLGKGEMPLPVCKLNQRESEGMTL